MTRHDDEPDDFALWELHGYCLGAVWPPGPVVRSRDNGRLLHAARFGMEWHAAAMDRRIADLHRLHLIERTGDRIRTCFPVIGPDAAAPLRRQARDLAIACLPQIIGPASRIREILTADDLAGHARTVVFGHALDGLTWKLLGERDAVPDTRPTAHRPLWNGIFWAIWPPRAEPAGVNEVAFAGMTLVMVWTDRTEAGLKALARSDGMEARLRAALEDASERQGDEVQRRARLPVIRPGDALHLESLAIAQTVADALLTEKLPRIMSTSGPRAARVIFGHELIWEISDLLRDAGLFADASDDPMQDLFLRIDPG